MKKLNSQGFGAVEMLLVVIIVGLIGGVGYFVYNSQKAINKSLDKANSSLDQASKKKKEADKPKTESEDETEDWTPYSSEKGKFSLRYPNSWVQPEHKDMCNTDLFDRALYIAPDKDSVLRCASEYFGQVSISSVEGDKQSNYDLGTDYKDVVTKDITINGVKGKRISGTAKPKIGDDAFAPLEGTTEIHYVFFTNGITYGARYTQAPIGHSPSTDVQKEFDLIITKTLKFQS